MKTILVPTDFSKPSVNAVHYAVEFAKQTKSKVLLLHAFQIPVISSEAGVVVIPFEEIEKAQNTKLKRMEEGIQKKYGKTVQVSHKAQAGFAVDVIGEIVKEKKIDLVVMGIKGAGKLSEVLVGSTSSAIAGNVDCPVLIIPEKCSFKKPKKVLFASDNGKPVSASNLKTLKEILVFFKSKIDFLNVRDESKLISSEKRKLTEFEKYFKDFKPATYFIKNKYDDVVAEINEFVKEDAADMVVMIARKHSWLQRLFNERKTKKMAFHTHVPLLIINDK